MATQQIDLLPNEIAALIGAKAHQIGNYISNSNVVSIDYDALAAELSRMHALTLGLREKAAALIKQAEAAASEANPS